MVDRETALAPRIKRISNALDRRRNADMEDMELTSTQGWLLGYLTRHRDRLFTPGDLVRQFGLTIVFAGIFSLFVSFTLTPMLASRFFRSGFDDHGVVRFGLFGHRLLLGSICFGFTPVSATHDCTCQKEHEDCRNGGQHIDYGALFVRSGSF